MGLKKGISNNLKGRPPGAVNKLSKDIRATITEFLQDSWPEVEAEFHKLTGKGKLLFYKELLVYSLPKLQAQAMKLDFGFEKLDDESLTLLCNKLIDRKNGQSRGDAGL